MPGPATKLSTLLMFFLLLAACSTDATVPQPTQKTVTLEGPTAVPNMVQPPSPTAPTTASETPLPTEIPTKVPAPSPTDPPPTPAPTATTEDPDINRKFGAAVKDYVRESWDGWDEGELIGQCLIDNATSITATAREAVIQHGIDEAFNEASGQDLASLSTVWDLCEAEAGSAEEETSTTASTDTTPELDAAFEEAVNIF